MAVQKIDAELDSRSTRQAAATFDPCMVIALGIASCGDWDSDFLLETPPRSPALQRVRHVFHVFDIDSTFTTHKHPIGIGDHHVITHQSISLH